MEFTLSNCIDRINQILNYPSLTYDDVSAFFDQAISELNTNLHIGLRSISECIAINNDDVLSTRPNVVIFTNEKDAQVPVKILASTPTDNTKYYYDSTQKLYGIRQTDGSYHMDSEIYAIYNTLTTEGIKVFKAIIYAQPSVGGVDGVIAWALSVKNDPLALNLLEYLPNDWIILFIIPYVCFKYSVRDGDTGALYSEEFTQGFQQLQQSYNVPSTVILATVADKKAYTPDVLHYLKSATLNIRVPVRAITEEMRTPLIAASVHSDFYDSNGWRY